jgi:hypothetical protein
MIRASLMPKSMNVILFPKIPHLKLRKIILAKGSCKVIYKWRFCEELGTIFTIYFSRAQRINMH